MGMFLELGSGIINEVLNFVGMVIYPLFGILFVLIDGVQDIFKSFAGTGDFSISGITTTGEDSNAGIVYFLFQSNVVKNIFFSILILALFLIIIFTVMAFIKNAYASKQKSWKDIVGSAFIGLANFVFIPVCCLLGVWLGNILLNAIDGATNTSGSIKMSGQLFISSAYNANDIRNGNYEDQKGKSWTTTLHGDVVGLVNYFKAKAPDNEVLINIVVENKSADLSSSDEAKVEVAKEYYAGIVDQVYATGVPQLWRNDEVAQWYTLIDINFVILAGGGVFMLYVLCAISFGMVKRLFILLMLFVISPAMCAMYPLDDGKAVGSWKSDFVKNTLSAYSAVAGMNLFFSLVPLIQQINIGGRGSNALDVMGLTQLLLTIAGLYVVKDFISMISGYIGAGNAYGDGASLMSSVQKRMKAGVGHVNKATKGVAGAFGRARGKASAGDVSFGKALFSDTAKSGVKGLNTLASKTLGIDVMGMADAYKDEFKASSEQAKGIQAYNQAVQQYKTAESSSDEEAMKAAMAEIKKAADNLGLGSKGIEKAAKAIGVSTDTFKAAVEAHKSISDAKKTYDEIAARSTTLDAAFDKAVREDDVSKLNEFFNIDIDKIASSRGIDRQLIVEELKNGVTTEFDEDTFRASSRLSGAALDRAVSEARIQYASMNKASENVTTLKQKSTEAAESLFEAVKTNNGKLLHIEKDAEGKTTGKTVRIDAADLTEMENNVKKGYLDSDNIDKIVKVLRESNSKDESEKQLRELKNIAKMLEKDKKK